MDEEEWRVMIEKKNQDPEYVKLLLGQRIPSYPCSFKKRISARKKNTHPQGFKKAALFGQRTPSSRAP